MNSKRYIKASSMGPVIRNSVLGTIFIFAAVTRVSAQAPAAPPPNAAKIPLSKIPRVHHAPKLEDFLENHPREAELTVTDFRQNVPGDGPPATEPTTASLSYVDKNLFVAFACHDDPRKVPGPLPNPESRDKTTAGGGCLTP